MNQRSDSSSFGSLLKDFRKRRNLTQQQLAEAAGVHRNAISRWEQGSVLPESKGMVLELARILQLDYQRGRQLLEASFTSLAPPWNVPYLRNPLFTGRQEYLEALHRYLNSEQITERTQSYALHGLGGIGKTQLAIEYAYRHALEYAAVFWIHAEHEEDIITSFLNIAELLQLPERREADQQRMIIACQRWLSSHSKWLLIWDNLEELELLARFLPLAGQGAILITTRNPAQGMLAQGIELPTMTQEIGVLFLLRRAKVIELEASGPQRLQIAQQRLLEHAAAKELVKLMDGLPLALDQVGAYVEETGCGLTGYLRLYEQQCKPLLNRRGTPTGGHPLSITATVLMTYERIKQSDEAAGEFICLCAFLYPDAIPEELLTLQTEALGPTLQKLASDRYQLDQAIALLRSFSLINRYASTLTLSIHRLVQAVIKEHLSAEETRLWIKRITSALNSLFPPGDKMENWPTCQRYLAHVEVCAHLIEQWQLVDAEAGRLLHQAGVYARWRAQYTQSLHLLMQAKQIRLQLSPSDHPDIAESYHELATLYGRQGKPQEAILLYQQALAIRERQLGPEHPQVAESLNELASLYWRLARHTEAESLFLRAIPIYERYAGPEHPSTAIVLSNLARLYADLKKYEESELLFLRALAICERSLGPQHLDTATVLIKLARLYTDLGRYEEAETLLLRSLHINEHALGSEHPDTAIILNSLARLYSDLGRYEEAETLLLRSLHINERFLGGEHPDTAVILNSLARLYSDLSRYAEAETLFIRALSVYEHFLGKDHPKIVMIQADINALHIAQEQEEQANVSL